MASSVVNGLTVNEDVSKFLEGNILAGESRRKLRKDIGKYAIERTNLENEGGTPFNKNKFFPGHTVQSGTILFGDFP